MPSSGKVQILNDGEIQRKLKRMAYEIYENCFHEQEIYVVGIKERGCLLAEHLLPYLKELSNMRIHSLEIASNKADASKYEFTPSLEKKDLKGKTVILVDDVLNTGKTLMYAASALLHYNCKQLMTAVLVNRRHRMFPIRADIVGLTLSTTLKEHIDVSFEGNKPAVYLR